MFYWIYDISTAQLAILFSVFFVGFTWTGTLICRPFLRLLVRRLPGGNDLIGYVLSCYCVFYGLLLGLIAVAAYQNFIETDRAVSEEAAAVTALYRDVTCYPDPDRTELQGLLREYIRYVIKEGWPLQRQGLVPTEDGKMLTGFLARLAEFEPKTRGQEIIHAETFSAFNDVTKLRRLRLFRVRTGIPAIMWYVVVIGAFLNIAFVWLFDMKLISHLFLGGMLSFFIGTVICLIAAMDNPFRGEVSIGPDAFMNVYETLMGGKTLAGR
jgi:hypothetical protein